MSVKAMIITVGNQANQIIFSIETLKPEYVGFLITNTENCKNALKAIETSNLISLSKCRILEVDDHPDEIGRIVDNFNQLYNWLINQENIPNHEIIVDATGGRKWMSSGAIMIASFLGLNIAYIHTDFINGQPNPDNMRPIFLGNAYEQIGFLEEAKADQLFNRYNFSAASDSYELLSHKLMMPRKVEIKKIISNGLLYWQQFNFQKAYDYLKDAQNKIVQFKILTEYSASLNLFLSHLEILKYNDQEDADYFQLLKNDDFSITVILDLLSQVERLEEIKFFDMSCLLLYRILEFIIQYRLAKHDIDSSRIPMALKEQHDDNFKTIKQQVTNFETSIPAQTGLLDSTILLYCLEDDLVKNYPDPNFLKGLIRHTQIRNYLWVEHRNIVVKEEEYRKFQKYVYQWVDKLNPKILEKLHEFRFIKF